MKKINKWLVENSDRNEKFYSNYDPKEDWYKTKFYIGDRPIGEVEKNDLYLYLTNMEVLIEENKLEFSKYRELRELKEVKSYIKETFEIIKEF